MGKVSCQKKQHNGRDWASNHRPSDLKSNALTNGPPRPHKSSRSTSKIWDISLKPEFKWCLKWWHFYSYSCSSSTNHRLIPHSFKAVTLKLESVWLKSERSTFKCFVLKSVMLTVMMSHGEQSTSRCQKNATSCIRLFWLFFPIFFYVYRVYAYIIFKQR